MSVGQPRRDRLVADRVLLVLVAVGGLAAWGAGFLTHAPNRIVTGRPIGFGDIALPWRLLLAATVAPMVVAVFRAPSRRHHLMVAGTAAMFATALLAAAGAEATVRLDPSASSARTAFGGAFWITFALAWLAHAGAVRRAEISVPLRLACGALFFTPGVVLLATGWLDHLSILVEYANRRDVFAAALVRHVEIVAATLAVSLVVGVPLGVLAFRRPSWRGPVFSVLGIVQTVPSIALFGLLMAPLAALADASPFLAGVGVAGIGPVPAVIALTLYSLLPIARSVVAGLGRCPEAVLEAARGLGFGRRRIFWFVEVPLAMPVLMSGLRVSLVQTIGIAVVAALIGAGGLGAIMFQGLAGSALDLVLLGVVPVVAMAAAADAGFRFVVTRLEDRAA